ncbi:hypothetical protein SARC_07463 [Sphaeroforma arctica JP610]|uniref:Uncharacterized protein n=1 Tax=Sphaeroforma arctica JP610 TaxID=667725 RepID=A0A0L0FTN0_9EUKA|nr:hypothetical protein SARC_07463 [Sphaeroforma arctica JP610]KNC80170.1 hypothetical protein SARC_07463 [Sphaeroforma arctica JP610]|eukprot:XP_014154072.1 hypothetical protein SARC_07463 [Sphaeroforma arctica JP610]
MEADVTVVEIIQYLVATYGPAGFFLTMPFPPDLIGFSTRLRTDSVYILKAKRALLSEVSKLAVKSVIYSLDQEIRPNRVPAETPGFGIRMSILQNAFAIPIPADTDVCTIAPAGLDPPQPRPWDLSPFRTQRPRTNPTPARDHEDLRNTLTRDSYHEFMPTETTRLLDRGSRAAAGDHPLDGPSTQEGDM